MVIVRKMPNANPRSKAPPFRTPHGACSHGGFQARNRVPGRNSRQVSAAAQHAPSPTARAHTSRADSHSARLDTPSTPRPSAATQRRAAAGGGSTPAHPPGAAPQLAASRAAPRGPRPPARGAPDPGRPSSLRAADRPLHALPHECAHACAAPRRRPEARPAAGWLDTPDAWQPPERQPSSLRGMPAPWFA